MGKARHFVNFFQRAGAVDLAGEWAYLHLTAKQARRRQQIAALVNRGVQKIRREISRKLRVFRSPMRAAVVGFGAIGPDHLESYEFSGLARVVAISDLRPARLATALDRWSSLLAYRDFRQMLREAKPDVVSVCTWPGSHAEIVCEAAEAGVKAILCEKPLAFQMDHVERMLSTCARHGTKLAGGHQYRFHGNFARAGEMIRAGAVGRVQTIYGCIRGSLANNGPHLIDTVRFLLGDPEAYSVSCRCIRRHSEFDRGVPAEESAQGEIQFAGGVPFEFQTGGLAAYPFSITTVGTDGSLNVSPTELVLNGGSVNAAEGSEFGDCRVEQFREFLQWVKGNRQRYAADHEEGARTTELVLALYESARTRAPVTLPLENKGDVISQLYWVQGQSRVTQPPVFLPRVSRSPMSPDRLAMDGGQRAMKQWFSGAPSMGFRELARVAPVILSRNLGSTGGGVVRALENEFADRYAAKAAVASTSGTASIHVALGSLNLNPCDEVITTPVTDIGTVLPILWCNCVPVFADVDSRTGNLTATSITRKITARTKAVIVVHLLGRPAELEAIRNLLEEKGIALIEDCSQAHFAEYRGRKVGTFGDFGCFSLQQSKQITCGDGGITLVNRGDLVGRAQMFVDKGWDRAQDGGSQRFLGMNYRMTELQGAVAITQLRRAAELIHARRQSARHLTEALRQIPGIVGPPEELRAACSWWKYPFTIRENQLGVTVEDFFEALRVEGVRATRGYVRRAVFEQDVLAEQNTYGTSRYPFSAVSYEPPRVDQYPGFLQFTREQIVLPWSSHVSRHHIVSIASAVGKVVRSLAQPTSGPDTLSLVSSSRRLLSEKEACVM